MLEIKNDGITLDGEKFDILSGSMHYFRIFPSQWKARLQLMKDFGLTVVQTYVPWNAHEKRPGEFDFSGMLDLKKYLKTASEVGLKVFLRPAPYICSEWDLGGLPWWLLKDRNMRFRCMDEKFIKAVERYYERLCKEFVPELSTNGGSVIAVCIENEYGSFGSDREYLEFIRDCLKKNGVDVPFYTTDGYDNMMLEKGTVGEWAGVNYRSESKVAIEALRKFQPDKPAFIGEFWSGRAIHMDNKFEYREVAPIAASFKEALENGGLVNFYMFGGGTNFGFMNGANYGYDFTPRDGEKEKYIAHATTYDEDAPISENGQPKEKYFALRDVLDDFRGIPRRERIMPKYETQEIKDVKFTGFASLFDNLDNLSSAHKSPMPKSMEELDFGFGYILYSAYLTGPCDGMEYPLYIDGLRDRATVYFDGEYKGCYIRDGEEEGIKLVIPEGGARLDIFVENMGRINYGRWMQYERKGITEQVRLNYNIVHKWENYPLPMDNIESVVYSEKKKPDTPTFCKATFKAKPGVDTFLRFDELTKGNVWINGFNIGRYWNKGPCETLYVPGELLKEENEIVVFEIHNAGEKVDFVNQSKLNGFVEGY